jgi:hypothetical protein
VITDETLGFEAHQAIDSWANETPSSAAIGFRPFTLRNVSSTRDLLARFWKEMLTQGMKNGSTIKSSERIATKYILMELTEQQESRSVIPAVRHLPFMNQHLKTNNKIQ